jgi:hypothetical protein
MNWSRYFSICTWETFSFTDFRNSDFTSDDLVRSVFITVFQDFLDRGLLLTRKLLNQGFLLVKLKSSLRNFYGRHHDLVDRYGISVSKMTTDMFHIRKAKKNRQHNDQKKKDKRTNNDLQNIHIKLKIE